MLASAMGTSMTLNKAARLIWEGRPWYHMWYLFMIIGLYAVTPLLRLYVARSGTALRWAVVVVSLAAASAWDLHLSMGWRPLPGTLPTMFIPYIGYYLIGYELRRLVPLHAHAGWLWAMVSVGAAATIAGTYALVKTYDITRLGLYMFEYLSPNVIVMSVGLFCLASKVEIERTPGPGVRAWLSRMVAWTAPLTLGIYMWHPMAIEALRHLGLTAIGTGSVFGVLVVALPAFCASLALTWGMSKVPLLRQSVGL
jgi:surface polysaccharide O-acyltransferase-like enzyme